MLPSSSSPHASSQESAEQQREQQFTPGRTEAIELASFPMSASFRSAEEIVGLIDEDDAEESTALLLGANGTGDGAARADGSFGPAGGAHKPCNSQVKGLQGVSLWDPCHRIMQKGLASGFCCMLVAAFFQSTTILFVDLCSLPTLEILCLRGLGAAILTIFKVWYSLEKGKSILREIMGKSWSNRGFLLLRSLLGATAIGIYFFAIKMMVIGDAVSIFFTNPVLVILWGRIILGEKINVRATLIAAPLALLGVSLVAHPTFIFGSPPRPYFLFGESSDSSDGDDSGGSSTTHHMHALGSMLAFSAAVVGSAALVTVRLNTKRGEPGPVVATWFHSVSAISTGIPIIAGFEHFEAPSLRNTYYMTMIIVLSALGQMFLSRAFSLGKAGTIGMANFTQVMWSYGYGVLFLHEKPTLSGILGALSILVGASVAALSQAKQNAKQEALQEAGGKAHVESVDGAKIKLAEVDWKSEESRIEVTAVKKNEV